MQNDSISKFIFYLEGVVDFLQDSLEVMPSVYGRMVNRILNFADDVNVLKWDRATTNLT